MAKLLYCGKISRCQPQRGKRDMKPDSFAAAHALRVWSKVSRLRKQHNTMKRQASTDRSFDPPIEGAIKSLTR